MGYGSTALAAELDAAKKAGLVGELARVAAGVPTVNDVATKYWLEHVRSLAPTTQRRYTDTYHAHIEKSTIAARPLSELTPIICKEWMDKVRGSSGVKCSARRTLTQILKTACDLELLDRNPMERVKPPVVKREIRHRILSPEEAVQLLEDVRGLPICAPVFLGAVLGLRRGEVCGLRWDNVGEDGLVMVCEQRQIVYTRAGGGAKEDLAAAPKRGKRRAFYVPPAILDEIKARGNLDHSHVCTVRGRLWRPDTLTRHWSEFAAEYRREDGFPLKDWTFHDLRHLAVGLLRRMGADYMLIQAICGHTNTAQTLEYMAVDRKETLESLGRLSDALGLDRRL